MGNYLRVTSLLSESLYKPILISSFSSSAPEKLTKVPTKWETKAFSHIFQECTHQRVQNPGKQAHARMTVSGYKPRIFVTNCLIQMYIKCSNLGLAHRVFDLMPDRDVVSWNAVVFGYAACGEMEIASSLFEAMPERDVVSWNSLISGFLHAGDCLKVTCLFMAMGRSGVAYNRRSFAFVLRACSILEDYDMGVQVHDIAVKTGFDRDVDTGTALVDMYAKCKKLDDSLLLFREISEKNRVSWSSVITGCAQNDDFVKGLELFKEMQKEGIEASQSTYASLLKLSAGFSAFRLGTQLHAHALKNSFGSDVVIGTATLDMYAKCYDILDARKLFNALPNHDLQSYNAIIVGYVRNGQGYEALQLFSLLTKSGLGFNDTSLSGAFSACAMIKGYLEGLQLHGLAIKSSLTLNICVANAIIDMYGKCRALTEACRAFDEMERRDTVSWNAIIAAYEQNGNEEKPLSYFVSMLRARIEPDEFTYGSILKTCASQQALNYGMEIHNRAIKSGMGLNWFVGCALVDMYCKCGLTEEAEKIHNRMKERNIVSWNAIISGFSGEKQSENAQRYFSRMLEMGVKPDNFTYAIVLDTCANLATVGLGKQIHAQVIKEELQSDVYISRALIDMYSKCGNMQDSRIEFDKAPKENLMTWNAMISCYAQHGYGVDALEVFENMEHENVKPNHTTFVSVLRACAHMGLVEKGLYYFKIMLCKYDLDPQLEHYSCLVDILGRSGQVGKALKLIQEMPFGADDVIWRTLLSICKIQGDVDVAEEAANSILQMHPQDSSAHILLSNIYANAGMWDKVSYVRKMMRQNRLKKEPGCSWIEVKDEVLTFLVGDKAHPKCEKIYENLGLLNWEMKRAGYVPDAAFLLNESTEENKQQYESRIRMCNL
ncbi:pentatricopeptide repeat-containing protein At3g02330, mitochondrial-like [Mangifera indica]|uniref:pentatricopeptide repeat-containing protein At3g02330, mitochondrial-like n=1 Tax=Mangifera indica TaxID=29780 RepID=UPI001CFA9854|nr:pentatricopeptide repeat-containing protein At3g02330, mitochondrial-like [Mangifera indica]